MLQVYQSIRVVVEIDDLSECRKHTSVNGHVFTTILFWVFTLGFLKAPTPRKTIKILIFQSQNEISIYFLAFFSAQKNKSERLLRCVKMYRSTRWFLVFISFYFFYFLNWWTERKPSLLPLFDHLLNAHRVNIETNI